LRDSRSVSHDSLVLKQSRGSSASSEDSARFKSPDRKRSKVTSNGQQGAIADEHKKQPSGTQVSPNDDDHDVLVLEPLDTKIAALLGVVPIVGPPKGPKIRSELATRWNVIARKGLPKEERESYASKFPIPRVL